MEKVEMGFCWVVVEKGEVRARFYDEKDADAFILMVKGGAYPRDVEGATEPRSEVQEWIDARVTTLEEMLDSEQLKVEDLGTRLQYLINWAAKMGYLEEGCFTFPDGESWEVA